MTLGFGKHLTYVCGKKMTIMHKIFYISQILMEIWSCFPLMKSWWKRLVMLETLSSRFSSRQKVDILPFTNKSVSVNTDGTILNRHHYVIDINTCILLWIDINIAVFNDVLTSHKVAFRHWKNKHDLLRYMEEHESWSWQLQQLMAFVIFSLKFQ